MMPTEQLYLTDAYLRAFESVVVATDANRFALAETAFYATGGGQPHDTGRVEWTGGSVNVVTVRGEDGVIWHSVEEGQGPPGIGTMVVAAIDWDRRHQLMRTHTALHILCGVIWNGWGRAVTGGNMEPLKARMDFEFDPLPDGFADLVTALVNAEIRADREIEVSFLPRDQALQDEELIRTKVNLIPETVRAIRIVDIVGLDRQADGGTHVARTGEVGQFQITKTESKGKGNKRLRIQLA
jgi:misacylated tRNA(Ala) deacylase